ncbi:hypothetical protein AGABI1DRAFT_134678 [Agaricus bisporus var. burnettii JB137-S8]|uniref:Uncharacterized protein n=2 Tax=Agaricus bisporus var. burnettii (strain JB137-S8 / ATCC MYA-4627 / FGSC 10392) TaxID=597362 RepID=K5WRW1_AGABU|nr:uncharacterized protein AGABI1DRAFT_134678 [Agaricus bisporus var. burnettii JB137-S8]EKM73488.1 hypothetical protein AGABI1DRAFT_134678 [Agaricus bisporus var. burnettii JB137-S8]
MQVPAGRPSRHQRDDAPIIKPPPTIRKRSEPQEIRSPGSTAPIAKRRSLKHKPDGA